MGLSVVIFLILVLALVALAGTVIWLWALVDLVRRPERQYAAVGQGKLVWLLLVLLGHVIGAVIYLLVCRPQLEQSQHRW